MREKKKPRRPITRLWNVGFKCVSGEYIIFVSEKPFEDSFYSIRKIRSCTAKAAGRRFARNNLAAILAASHYEVDHWFSSGELTPEMIKEFKKKSKYYSIKVIK